MGTVVGGGGVGAAAVVTGRVVVTAVVVVAAIVVTALVGVTGATVPVVVARVTLVVGVASPQADNKSDRTIIRTKTNFTGDVDLK